MRALLLAHLRLVPTLIRHRFLVRQLAWRSFASRHAGSFLGWLWTPLSTVVQFAVFVIVFSKIMEIKIGNLGIDLADRPSVGFGVYLITGLVPFLALNDAVVRASRVFRAHAALVQRVRLPAEVLVFGDALGALLHHVLAFVVVLIICAVRGHLALSGVPWLVGGLLLIGLWIAGLCLVASLVGAVLPDIAEVLTLILQVAFYGAPIVYPLSLVGEPLLWSLIELNPLTPMIGVLRAGLIGSAPPSVLAISLLFIVGAGLLVTGSAVLERWKTRIPDLI